MLSYYNILTGRDSTHAKSLPSFALGTISVFDLSKLELRTKVLLKNTDKNLKIRNSTIDINKKLCYPVKSD